MAEENAEQKPNTTLIPAALKGVSGLLIILVFVTFTGFGILSVNAFLNPVWDHTRLSSLIKWLNTIGAAFCLEGILLISYYKWNKPDKVVYETVSSDRMMTMLVFILLLSFAYIARLPIDTVPAHSSTAAMKQVVPLMLMCAISAFFAVYLGQGRYPRTLAALSLLYMVYFLAGIVALEALPDFSKLTFNPRHPITTLRQFAILHYFMLICVLVGIPITLHIVLNYNSREDAMYAAFRKFTKAQSETDEAKKKENATKALLKDKEITELVGFAKQVMGITADKKPSNPSSPSKPGPREIIVSMSNSAELNQIRDEIKGITSATKARDEKILQLIANLEAKLSSGAAAQHQEEKTEAAQSTDGKSRAAE